MEMKVDPRQLVFDERLKGGCAYCGSEADTRDHVPSRVLLDKPYPPDLPVVGACKKCNNGFSIHERLVACLVDCAACGGTETPRLRPSVRRMLAEDDRLTMQVELVLRAGASWLCEQESVGVVLEKLARGHQAFLEYPVRDALASVRVAARPEMSADDLWDFDQLPTPELLPEIGTRAFVNLVVAMPAELTSDQPKLVDGGWNVVQEGRYRYVSVLTRTHTTIRFVIGEYLFCEVVW